MMNVYDPGHIRNVILMSHYGAGKTTLAEAMLFTSGAVKRFGRVDDGTTISDYDPGEIERHMSISLSLLPYEWLDDKINLIDSPGYADFAGEVSAGLRVVEGAIVIVDAASGVEVGTEQAWAYAEADMLPRLLFVNKMDRDNAAFFDVIDQIQNKLSTRCFPVQLPVGSQKDFKGILDLVTMKAYGDVSSQEIEVSSSLLEQAKAYREKLVEAVVEADDELLVKYLDGEQLSNEQIFNAMRQASLAGTFVPIFAGSALRVIGISSLLDAINTYLPSPQRR